MEVSENWLAIATIIAVLLGPIAAVIVTRIIDSGRETKRRKMEIFRTLMRTRKMPVHHEHVGALNLVEIEFSKDRSVVAAWRDYLGSLGEPLPPMDDAQGHEALSKKRDARLTKLIHEIAQVLNFRVEQLDILEGNYIPQGWNDAEWNQKQVQKGLLDLLQGRSALRVNPIVPANTSPYPPPPEVRAIEKHTSVASKDEALASAAENDGSQS